MGDVRNDFYRNYVSRFKDVEQSDGRTRSLATYFPRKYGRYFEGLHRESRLLEAGCGDGLFLSTLARLGFENLEGVDISAEQVELAIRRRLRVVCADTLSYLDGRAREYDMIVALDVIEHFNREEALKFFRVVFSALKPGGRLLLQTANGEGLLPGRVIHGDLTHCTIFTPGSLTQVLRLIGFEGIEFSETGPVAVGIKGRLRVMLWSVLRQAANAIRIIEAGVTQPIWTENLICCCRTPVSAP